MVALVAAILIYFNVIRDDAPDAFVLTEATGDQSTTSTDGETETTDTAGAESGAGEGAGTTTGTEGTEGTDGETGGGAAAGGAAGTGQDTLDGTWVVGTGSEAGYRVVEDLRGVQDFEAVGRTEEITGTVEITGTTITDAGFEVDVASITSDDGRRDSQFSGAIMNAADFPTADFVLTEPIELGSQPEPGSAINATATGELTLRGETNAVSFPVDAQLLDGRIEIVGSIAVLFSDYGIDNPSNPVVTVRDEGEVEVRLLLDKS